MNTLDLPLPLTTTRVAQSTAAHVNERIRMQTQQDVRQTALAGIDAITKRLQELDAEWDIERALETNAATASLIALTLGFTEDRRWFALPVLISGFLLQHALQGWCPPIPIMRKLGFRTEREINLERTALRILRGDFTTSTNDPDRALAIAAADDGIEPD